MAKLTTKASSTGIATTPAIANGRCRNGSHHHGSALSWFQSMKSGMPGVDWIAVLLGSDASSFRNMAMA
ncbi:hypothetical protein D3C72_2098030 [compost metagenome]